MDIRTELLADIAAFLAEEGIAESTFGRMAVNDGKFVGRLRAGKGVTIDTVERVRRFLAERRAARAERAA